MIKLNSNGSQVGGKFDRIEVRGKNVTIKDVVVEGDGVALYSNYNCSGLVVEDSTFISHSNNSVKIIADNVGGVIKNVVFKNCSFKFARMGAEIQNHKNADYKIDGIRFEGCTFISDGESGYKYGLSLSGYGRNAVVKGCKFRECVKGVEIVGFSDVTIEDCDIAGSAFSVISSNDRGMKNITIEDCYLNGMIRLTNCSDSTLRDCDIDCPYVEIKNSEGVLIAGNTITSTGHYSVMLNQSSACKVQDNVLRQRSTANWSVIRCYGKQAKGNVLKGNTITRAKKVGKVWDEYNGASGNIFVK